MKPHIGLYAAAAVLLVALPALAQENRGAAGSSAAGTGVAQSGGAHSSGGGSTAGTGSGSSSGGGTASTSGGSSGGGSGYSGGGGSGRMDVSGRHGATGGSGTAVYRAGDRGDRGAAGAGAHGRDGGSATTGHRVAVTGGSNNGGTTAAAGGTAVDRTPDSGAGGAPPHARPRDGNEPIVGTAVPRGSVPPAGGGGTIIGNGGYAFYPWWFGGAGYYGGYYGGYYDPWYGGYPGGFDPGPQVYTSYADEGSLRLKIKPRDAEVYVDGYFVGVVDDFDGVFQRLHIETGAHRIEVRAAGYEPLAFDVRITPDHSTTYQGELKRVQ
jgi:hypothetical protein